MVRLAGRFVRCGHTETSLRRRLGVRCLWFLCQGAVAFGFCSNNGEEGHDIFAPCARARAPPPCVLNYGAVRTRARPHACRPAGLRPAKNKQSLPAFGPQKKRKLGRRYRATCGRIAALGAGEVGTFSWRLRARRLVGSVTRQRGGLSAHRPCGKDPGIGATSQCPIGPPNRAGDMMPRGAADANSSVSPTGSFPKKGYYKKTDLDRGCRYPPRVGLPAACERFRLV